MKRKIAIILLTSIFSTQFVYADNISISNSNSNPNVIGSVSTITKNEKGETVVDTDNKVLVKKYGSIDSQVKGDMKVTLDASFVKDRNFSGLTAILSLDGFIPSGKKIYEKEERGIMEWPYEYGIQVRNISNDNEVKIIKTTPKNTILDQNVSNTISYSVGGGVQITSDFTKPSVGASANVNANYTDSKTISYSQPEYKTVQTIDRNDLVSWKTTFVKTKEGYTLDSDGLYGNEMFMLKRYQNKSTTNFLGDDQISSLISGGFNPNVGLVLVAPKDVNKSVLEVTLTRKMSTYNIKWYTAWVGKNKIDTSQYKETMLFEIDWVNNTVRNISEIPDLSKKDATEEKVIDSSNLENVDKDSVEEKVIDSSNVENADKDSVEEKVIDSSNIENADKDSVEKKVTDGSNVENIDKDSVEEKVIDGNSVENADKDFVEEKVADSNNFENSDQDLK